MEAAVPVLWLLSPLFKSAIYVQCGHIYELAVKRIGMDISTWEIWVSVAILRDNLKIRSQT